jgi:hypothetical protein
MIIYPMLERARALAALPGLDILEGKQPYASTLVNNMRHWLGQQPSNKLSTFDFRGVRAITSSFAEEIGPLFMQMVARDATLQQRYPVYQIDHFEHAYTLGLVFAAMNWTGLAFLHQEAERSSTLVPLDTLNPYSVVVLGSLSLQMEQILQFAHKRAIEGAFLTSEMLSDLPFLKTVSIGARSKRLTELYERRLLALIETRGHERRFIPTWKLADQALYTRYIPHVTSQSPKRPITRKKPARPASGIMRIKPDFPYERSVNQ